MDERANGVAMDERANGVAMDERAVRAGSAVRAGELTVGSVRLAGRCLLAPMSGISDAPFRRLAARFGASLTVTEMIASDRLVAREEEARLKLEGAGLAIHAVQLAGCRAADLSEGAKLAEAAGADLIDINMGCPAKRVVGGLAGSALMRDVDHAAALIEATVEAVAVPVTVKMRLGYDRTLMTAPALARRAEAAGAQLITVHGRTRCQRYRGTADWRAIRAVREATTLPLVANGDGRSVADAHEMLARSGADAVMIGRAAEGAPWLPGVIAAALDGRAGPDVPQTPAALGALALEHLEALVAHAGPFAVRQARKHLCGYAAHVAHDPAHRRAMLTVETPEAAAGAVKRLFAEAGPLPHNLAATANDAGAGPPAAPQAQPVRQAA